MSAACDIDEAAIFSYFLKFLPVQDSPRLRRERQKTNNRVAARKNFVQVRRAVDPVQFLRSAAPAGDVEIHRPQLYRDRAAKLAQSQDADSPVRSEELAPALPGFLDLEFPVAPEVPVPIQHVGDGRLAHRGDH